MASIQSLGVGSGLDVNSIVTQLLAVEKQPLTRLKQVEAGVQAKISAYGNVRSKLDALEASAQKLSSAVTWSQTKVDLGGADEFIVSATGAAAEGTVDIEVLQLARKQTTAFRATSSTFAGTSPVDITVAGNAVPVNPGDSLDDIRDAINALNPAVTGIRASVMNDIDGSVLVMTSVDTGENASFSVTIDPALTSMLGVPAETSARNMHVKVDGVSLYAATNTLSDVVQGLAITANQVTSGPRTVKVQRDTASVKTSIESFVNGYNDLMTYIRQQTAFNESTKTGGLLQSDRVAVSLQSQIRSAITGSTGASNLFDRLSDLGITLQRDGRMQILDTELDAALENVDEVSKLFSRDETNSTLDGVAVRLGQLIDDLSSTDGSLALRQNGLQAALARNQRDQDRASDRLAQTEARLKAQYAALDTKMASLAGLGQYVSQQVQQYNKASA